MLNSCFQLVVGFRLWICLERQWWSRNGCQYHEWERPVFGSCVCSPVHRKPHQTCAACYGKGIRDRSILLPKESAPLYFSDSNGSDCGEILEISLLLKLYERSERMLNCSGEPGFSLHRWCSLTSNHLTSDNFVFMLSTYIFFSLLSTHVTLHTHTHRTNRGFI